MRTIKFRAWIKEHKSVSKGVVEKARMTDVFTFSDFDGDYFKPEDVSLANMEIMQFTGLFDKNGKEIYEGDVVRVQKTVYETVYEVVYSAPSFYLRKNPQDNVDLETFSTPFSYEEIIGNIYQNPELIN